MRKDGRNGIMINNLYHYTSVESLAMILKNKSFRFSPLSVLDDLMEEKVRDWQKFGEYVFVSSWTEDGEESIPMWNMYAGLDCGIRIKMKVNPFKTYALNTEYLKREYPNVQIQQKSEGGYELLFPVKEPVGYTVNFTIEKLIIPNQDFFTGNYYLYNCTPENSLYKIKYEDNENLLIPKIINDSSIDFSMLGKFKGKCWGFQKEWRYILYFSPVGLKNTVEYPCDSMRDIFLKYGGPVNSLPFRYYFLKLDDAAFNNMEITLSPKLSEGYRTIVQLLKEKYNPNMVIRESALKGILR